MKPYRLVLELSNLELSNFLYMDNTNKIQLYKTYLRHIVE